MTVDELIFELQKISDDNKGDLKVDVFNYRYGTFDESREIEVFDKVVRII